MCSIMYVREFTEEVVHATVDYQINRWYDSFWFITGDFRLKDSCSFVKQDDCVKEIKDTISDSAKKYHFKKWFLMHIRKTSVWKDNVENAHPVTIKDNEIFIIQNWTYRWILEWAKLEYPDQFDDTRSDTYRIWKWLYKRTNWKIEKATKFLEHLKDVWIIFFINRKENKVLLYSDGSRDCYVKEIEKDEKKYLDFVYNYKPECKNTETRAMYWFIYFDLDTGEIYDSEYTNSCKEIKHWTSYVWGTVVPTSNKPAIQTSLPASGRRQTHWEDVWEVEEDDYWDDKPKNPYKRKTINWNNSDILKFDYKPLWYRNYTDYLNWQRIPSSKKRKVIKNIAEEIKDEAIDYIIQRYSFETTKKIVNNIVMYLSYYPMKKFMVFDMINACIDDVIELFDPYNKIWRWDIHNQLLLLAVEHNRPENFVDDTDADVRQPIKSKNYLPLILV